MDQIYPDNGLTLILKNVASPSVTYHLFTNDYLPQLGDTVGTYTEAAWSGYAPIVVPQSAFSFIQVVGHIASVQALNVLFLNTSGSTVYVFGYYVTDPTNTILIAAARFDGAPLSITNGNGLPVTPIMSNYSALTQ